MIQRAFSALVSVVLLLVSPGCIKSSSHVSIAGGSEAVAGDDVALATVALMDGDGRQFCSGVLIDRRRVLTAAHCAKDFTGSVVYTAFALRAKADEVDAAHLISGSFHASDDYDRAVMFGGLPSRPPNDIAVVALDSDAPADHQPAARLQFSDAVAKGDTVVLAGFGFSSGFDRKSNGVLRQISTTIVALSPASKELLIRGREGQAACNGDSGGPAYVRTGDGLKLLGLTSRGTGLDCASDTVYTDVRYFAAWVQGD